MRIWDGITGGLALFSVAASVFHLFEHRAPLLPTILGQWLLFALAALFAALSYHTLRKVESGQERAVVGRRTCVAYGFGSTVSTVYAFHQYLTPLADIRLDGVLFRGIFVGVTAGIAGLFLGHETVRRRRKRRDLEDAVEELERRRRELQRKDDQLEGFATAITHELRNSVGIVSGYAELLSRIADEKGHSELRSKAELIVEETGDIEEVVEKLKTLARYSQAISETTSLDLEEIARTAERRADGDELDVIVEDSIVVEGHHERLQELFENVFRFAAQNGATGVQVHGRNDGFVVVDDGFSSEEFDEEEIFAYGNAAPDAETEMLLSNVRVLATSHGWDVSLTGEGTAGTKITIRDVGMKSVEN